MSRILIIGDHTEFHTGGVATHVATIAKELSEMGFCVTVLVLVKEGGGRTIEKGNLKIIGSNGFLRHVINIIREVKRHDIVHTHTLISTLFVKILFPKKKLLRTVHGYYSLERIARGQLKESSLNFKIIRHLEMLGVEVPNWIITVDRRIRKWLLSLRRIPDKLTTIPNTPDFKTLSGILKASRRARKQLITIGYAKALTSKNGPEYLILGFKEVISRLPQFNMRLVIIGDGELRSYLEDLTRKLKIQRLVEFRGNLAHKETLKVIAEEFDVLVVPSVNVAGVEEATSIVAQEAMYLGVPVIASNIGGLKEIIRHEKNGLLVKERDPVDLAEKLILLIESPKLRKRISYLGKKVALSNNMCKRTLEVYKKLI
ncbi:glycosyltransferase family 4 protein [Pyrococcus kukulkanii]|uniref:glycosyltransferase family 4 protein n=1 Tax=Pyrococcus kukulkanii TaxID=1609559 RepID=UPI0035667E4F